MDAGSDAEDSTPHLLLVLGFDINKICILPLNAAKALIAPVVDKPATLYTFAGGGQVTCISSFRVPATPYTRLFIGTSIGTLGMCTFSIKDDEVSWQTWTVMKNKSK